MSDWLSVFSEPHYYARDFDEITSNPVFQGVTTSESWAAVRDGAFKDLSDAVWPLVDSSKFALDSATSAASAWWDRCWNEFECDGLANLQLDILEVSSARKAFEALAPWERGGRAALNVIGRASLPGAMADLGFAISGGDTPIWNATTTLIGDGALIAATALGCPKLGVAALVGSEWLNTYGHDKVAPRWNTGLVDPDHLP